MKPTAVPKTRGARIRKFVLWTVGLAAAAVLLGTAILVIAGLTDNPGTADIALVLGNKVELDGTPSPRLRARLDRTLELYQAGSFPAVIVSGGIGKEGFDEAAVMRDYLVSHGIPSDRVIVDNRGTTTFMSAQNTLAIVRQQKLNSVFVVSQYFHVPRTRLALKRFGISTVYSAHAHFFETRDIYSSPRELFGYLRYWFRHYDSEAAPTARSPLRITLVNEPEKGQLVVGIQNVSPGDVTVLSECLQQIRFKYAYFASGKYKDSGFETVETDEDSSEKTKRLLKEPRFTLGPTQTYTIAIPLKQAIPILEAIRAQAPAHGLVVSAYWDCVEIRRDQEGNAFPETQTILSPSITLQKF